MQTHLSVVHNMFCCCHLTERAVWYPVQDVGEERQQCQVAQLRLCKIKCALCSQILLAAFKLLKWWLQSVQESFVFSHSLKQTGHKSGSMPHLK